MKNYMLYIHKDIDGKIFYVGCTKDKYRPYHKHSNVAKKPQRSIEWYNRCNNQFTVEIVAEGLSEEEAFQLEIDLISKYGREIDGGILVNKSTGGKFSATGYSGIIGSKHSNETKLKMSKTRKGRKVSSNHKDKLRQALMNEKNPMYGKPAANRKKVICTLTGKIWDCVKHCAEYNNINYSTLKCKLNGSLNNNTTFKYLN